VVNQPEGLQKELLLLTPECRRWVLEQAAEIERLRDEIVWCHDGMTTAYEALNEGLPIPDWSMLYRTHEAAEAAWEMATGDFTSGDVGQREQET